MRAFTTSGEVLTSGELDAVAGDPGTLRRAYGCFPSGVTAICAMAGAEPVGMAASSFTTVSMEPPLVSVCIQQTSTTWPKLRARPRLGVSVLAEEHHDVCRSLSAKDGDRFAGVNWRADQGGAVFIGGAPLWLDCSLHTEVEAGDHLIALLEIERLRIDPDAAPLVFHASRFRLLAQQ